MSVFLFLFPVFKETSVRWLVTQGLITMATEGLVSPVTRRVPPAQVSHIYTYCVGQRIFCYYPICNALKSSLKSVSVCFSGTGIEACTKCADGYLLEDWRCVSSCSSGYYLSEQTSDNGLVQRSCKKWVSPPSNTFTPQWKSKELLDTLSPEIKTSRGSASEVKQISIFLL